MPIPTEPIGSIPRGHDVSLANTGTEAVSRFQEVAPEVVILDIGMPEPDGYEVARHIRKNSAAERALMLVALTGWGQEADKERAVAAGFDHHFTKPVHPDQLKHLLRAQS